MAATAALPLNEEQKVHVITSRLPRDARQPGQQLKDDNSAWRLRKVPGAVSSNAGRDSDTERQWEFTQATVCRWAKKLNYQYTFQQREL